MMRQVDWSRRSGSFLAELMITLTVLTVGILGFMRSFQANFQAATDAAADDRAQLGLENVMSMLRNSTFNTLYTAYQDKQVTVTEIDTYGTPMQVSVHFDVNETTLPAAYGPLAGDLDGDGKNTTTDASLTYKILPARLQVSYQSSRGTLTRTMYVLLASI